MACTKKISGGIGIPCTPLPGGTNDKLILINYDELESYTLNINRENVVSTITRTTGTTAYLFEGIRNSIVARDGEEEGTYFPNFKTEIDFIAFSVSSDTRKVLKELGSSKVVAVYESNGYYNIAGLKGGVVLVSAAADTSNADTGGGYLVTLRADQEDDLVKIFGTYTGTYPNDTYDYSASKALFDALLVAAP